MWRPFRIIPVLKRCGYLSTRLQRLILQHPESAYAWVQANGMKPMPEAEPAIARSPQYATMYAQHVLEGRFELGEPAIAESGYALAYAHDIMKGRFPLAEPRLQRSPLTWHTYQNNIREQEESDRWAKELEEGREEAKRKGWQVE